MALFIDNARIWTADPARPWASRARLDGGRVVAMDEDASADDAERLEAGGGTVVPGMIDAHVHLMLGGIALGELDLSDVTSPDEFRERIAQRHRELPPGRWLIANGWSNGNWTGHELPDRSWLAAAGDRPVVCRRSDLHAFLVNEAVLDRIDTDHDPPGGRIERDANGAPTGLLVEAAAWDLVNPLIPAPDAATRQKAVLAAAAHANALGLTAVGSMELRSDVEEVFAPLRERLTVRCRITQLDWSWPPAPEWAAGFAGDERLAVIGCKAFLDGTFGSRSARMREDYADDPGNRGLFLEAADETRLGAWGRAVVAAGLSPSIHAIGDEAVGLALDIAEACDGRVRIEHAQHVDPADLPRFVGVTTSMQPLHKADDGRFLEAALGPRRASTAFPFRSLLQSGAHLAFGSDWPVVSCDPLAGVRAAVTGLTFDGRAVGVEQTLTVEASLTAYTRGAAVALGMSRAGILRPGAFGDLVLLDRDPFAADWVDAPPRVMLTVMDGRVVYDER